MKKKRDYLSFSDLSREEVWGVLSLAAKLKKKPLSPILRGRTVGLIFQKPSTRTSVSFAVGMVQLGGHPLLLNADLLQIKRGESPKDTGRVLSRYLDAIVIRTLRHDDLVEMAKFACIPLINGLTDEEHPCQVLADLLTILEKKKIKNPKDLKNFHLAYVGDGNNIAHSLILAAGVMGFKLTLGCPSGYGPKQKFLDQANELKIKGEGEISLTTDPMAAVQNADAVYTDVWASMGQEAEHQARQRIFSSYQVNAPLLSYAKKGALVMHCLPAHRGEEITEDIFEGPQSVVFDQAENRLHVQKAILATLINGKMK